MSQEKPPEQIVVDARSEKIAFGIIGVIIAAMGIGYGAIGLAGVGIIALALVPVIYFMLVIMAGGKG